MVGEDVNGMVSVFVGRGFVEGEGFSFFFFLRYVVTLLLEG